MDFLKYSISYGPILCYRNNPTSKFQYKYKWFNILFLKIQLKIQLIFYEFKKSNWYFKNVKNPIDISRNVKDPVENPNYILRKVKNPIEQKFANCPSLVLTNKPVTV